MWFGNSELVAIIITGTTRVYCWTTYHSSGLPIIQAFETHNYTNNELIDGKIFNHAQMRHDIHTFLQQHQIKKPFLALGITPPHEKILFTPAQTLSADQFFADESDQHTQSNSLYCGPTPNNQHLHYTCSLRHADLLHYKLLAHLMGLSLIQLTTINAALLHALCHKGLLDQKNQEESLQNYIKRSLNHYTLGEQVMISDILSNQIDDHKEVVVSCLGLFLLGRRRNGKT
ncbi:MAG: hypothetical protein WD068_01940 [Candidatus Babeliales bacterium]